MIALSKFNNLFYLSKNEGKERYKKKDTENLIKKLLQVCKASKGEISEEIYDILDEIQDLNENEIIKRLEEKGFLVTYNEDNIEEEGENFEDDEEEDFEEDEEDEEESSKKKKKINSKFLKESYNHFRQLNNELSKIKINPIFVNEEVINAYKKFLGCQKKFNLLFEENIIKDKKKIRTFFVNKINDCQAVLMKMKEVIPFMEELYQKMRMEALSFSPEKNIEITKDLKEINDSIKNIVENLKKQNKSK